MIQALGPLRVPTPGTPVAVASLLPAEMRAIGYTPIHAILLSVIPTNTDDIYVMVRYGPDGRLVVMNRTTYAGVQHVLGVPTVNFRPSYQAALQEVRNGLTIEDFYIDADVANEGVLVGVVVV